MLVRAAAVGLVLLEAAALVVFSGNVALAAVAATAAILALWLKWRFQPTRTQRNAGIIFLAVIAALPHQMGLYPARVTLMPGMGPLLFLCDLALMLQVSLLFYQPLPNAVLAKPGEFLFFGMAVMIGAGAGRALAVEQARYGLFALAFSLACLWLIALLQPRTLGTTRLSLAPRIVVVFLLAFSAGLGWFVSNLVGQYGHQLDRLLVGGLGGAIPVQSLGFSRSATLNSITNMRGMGEQITLRAYSDSPPGYLRACAYDHYDAGVWRNSTASRPAMRLRQDTSQRTLFRILAVEAEERPSLEVWQELLVRDSLFLPSNAAQISADADQVLLDGHDAAVVRGLNVRQPISVFTGERDLPPPADHRLLLQLPPALDPRIALLADALFSRTRTVREKADAVEQHFLSNYTYTLGVRIPAGDDPLNYFLLDRPAAHCEFFAAGAVVLLRLAGVPCRYVTGFVVLEQNPLDGAWIARSRDAHAWVEAYDPATGWFIVEATPPAGVPHLEHGTWWSYMRESLVQQWRRLRLWFSSLLTREPAEWAALAVLLIVAAIGASVAAVSLLRQWKASSRARYRWLSPQILALRKELVQQDRKLRARGLSRQGPETLHQFAGRIEQEQPALEAEAEWYRQYAARRYQAHDRRE